MNYEVELKYPLDDAERVRDAVAAMGAQWTPAQRQCDVYFAHPQRDFAVTDDAFRLRTIDEQNRLTYKGPLIDRETKTRQEIEVAFADGAHASSQMITMLSCLGFREVRRVAKTRRAAHVHWQDQNVEVLLDEVDQLGTFVEIEILADEAHWESAKAAALALAERLGLSQSERRSYLQLLIERDGLR